MIRKTLGYVLAALGVVGVAAWTLPSFKATIPDFALVVNAIGGDLNLIIASAVLLILGLFLIVKSGGGHGGQKGREVPIYHGKNIVGYRRG